jgi:C-terminal processing protease CtpA/Prc
MFAKVSREYPFTEEKNIDWQALHDQISPRIAEARDSEAFYRALHDFIQSIPDAHVGMTIDSNVFVQTAGGGFGLVLAELSDGTVIVTKVLPQSPAEKAGIEVGAEILTWDGKAVEDAIANVEPFFGPSSTEHHRRLEQVAFLAHVPPQERIEVSYKNPGEAQEQKATLRPEVEIDSLFQSLPLLNEEEVASPIQGDVLEESGLGYIRISTFSGDYNLMAQLWDHYMQQIVDQEVPGLIIDVRTNPGGNPDLAMGFAGYFFKEKIELSQGLYYSEESQSFEPEGLPTEIEPGPLLFEGPVAVLVGPYCVSACEGFAYAMTQEERATVVGNFPSAGAFGEVGRGQYELPGELSLQFPTGRPETPEGELLIEGVGVPPDITVPVTKESALGEVDAVLEEAVKAVQKEL